MPPLAGEQAGRLLATMWRIRLFEERVGRLTRDGEVHGLIHLSTGQEGVAVGVCAQLRAADAVYSGHRGHGHAIAKGAPLEQTMAELMGRDGGLCRGLGGSMHLVDVEHGFLGATGVVGGNIPIALGSALAARLRGDDAVAVVFFGDGAVQAGHFNETINPDRLKLPLILVCENNGFAEFTSFGPHRDRTGHGRAVRRRAATVDGNDASPSGMPLRAGSPGAQGEVVPARMPTVRLGGHYEGDAGQEAIAAVRNGRPGIRSSASNATESRRGGSPRMSWRRSKRRLSPRSTRPCSSGATARSHPSA
jgi:pyruvate dehydrogenase E1 component alpha subunit